MRGDVRLVWILGALIGLHGCTRDFHGTVISATDGDTIVVREGATRKKIRLFGIDCPEYTQAYGKQARAFTADLALNKTVRVYPLYNDQHGRLVAKVYLPDGRYLNAEIVAAGYAWWFRKYAPRDRLFERLEHEAKIAKRGLWSDEKTPVEPWNFRYEEHPNATPKPETRSNSPMEISYLHCNGSGEKEADEYVEIRNRSSSAIDMSGWLLHDEGRNHSIRFAKGFRMGPQQKCKIYTDLETGCLSFRESKTAVWNNHGDRAYLSDQTGQIQTTRSCDD